MECEPAPSIASSFADSVSTGACRHLQLVRAALGVECEQRSVFKREQLKLGRELVLYQSEFECGVVFQHVEVVFKTVG